MNIEGWDSDKKILIIAEIGNNHEGSYSLAEELIGLAARAGVDAVKFQTIVPERLVTPDQTDRIRQLEKFRLSYNEFEKLSNVAKKEGVIFLSTPFDIESARFLDKLVPAFKISSGDNNFYPLIEVICHTGKPVILSSGLTDIIQIKAVKDFIEEKWQQIGFNQDLAVLHCVTSYPTPPQDANLLAIKQLSEQLGVTAGYSDHTLGIEAAVTSAALGARIIEKHFTIDKHYSEFRDHQLSADPEEMAALVSRVRDVAVMLGDGNKQPQPGEKVNETAVRRSIVAARDLSQGIVVKRDDLIWLRPGGGLPPGEESLLLGKKLKRSVKMGEYISLRDIDEQHSN